MRILFVRHGQPRWFGDDLIGFANPELTDKGHAQAEDAAQALASVHVDHLWVSPTVRSRQTAEPIARALGMAGTLTPWLEEVRIPTREGVHRDELRAQFDAARQLAVDDWWAGLPGCEPYSDFVTRIGDGLDGALSTLSGGRREDIGDARLWHDLPDQTVVCVCHAGTTAAAISHLAGFGQVPWAWLRLPVAHASISELKSLNMSTARCFMLARLNDEGHMSADRRSR
jgi:probable phosphoglycerate mutase